MGSRTSLLAALAVALAASGCGPGADVNGWPNAAAAAYCHFAYHCCTPADRTNFPDQIGSFAGAASSLQFDNESECVQKLSDLAQNSQQPIEASAKDKRLTWNSQLAQACLDAINQATAKCDAQAFVTAITVNANSPVKAVCDSSHWTTGAVAPGNDCVIDEDCAGTGSYCEPTPQTGNTRVIRIGGTCNALPTKGQTCNGFGANSCAPGDSCCNGNVCVAYQAEGAVCSFTGGGFGGGCSPQPCDPQKDFCGFSSNAYACQALIANGAACGKDQQGNLLRESCLSGNCDMQAGTCTGAAQVTYNLCKGNPDGI